MLGNVANPWGTIHQTLEANANKYAGYNLDISGESGDHIVGGYLIVDTWKSGEVIVDIHNHNTAGAAAIIAVDSLDNEFTIGLAAGGFSGRLPLIAKLKVTGTDDDLTVFTQKIT